MHHEFASPPRSSSRPCLPQQASCEGRDAPGLGRARFHPVRIEVAWSNGLVRHSVEVCCEEVVAVVAEGDDPRIEKAVSRFQSLAGSQEAEARELVQALMSAAQDQMLETITGSGTVPSKMVAVRAELLYHACARAERILEQREVEVLFRTLPTDARAILANMHATYEEALRERFLERMRHGARVGASGTDATGL